MDKIFRLISVRNCLTGKYINLCYAEHCSRASASQYMCLWSESWQRRITCADNVKLEGAVSALEDDNWKQLGQQWETGSLALFSKIVFSFLCKPYAKHQLQSSNLTHPKASSSPFCAFIQYYLAFKSRQFCVSSQAVTTRCLTASSCWAELLFTVFAHPKTLLWFLAVYMLQIT